MSQPTPRFSFNQTVNPQTKVPIAFTTSVGKTSGTNPQKQKPIVLFKGCKTCGR